MTTMWGSVIDPWRQSCQLRASVFGATLTYKRKQRLLDRLELAASFASYFGPSQIVSLELRDAPLTSFIPRIICLVELRPHPLAADLPDHLLHGLRHQLGLAIQLALLSPTVKYHA